MTADNTLEDQPPVLVGMDEGDEKAAPTTTQKLDSFRDAVRRGMPELQPHPEPQPHIVISKSR